MRTEPGVEPISIDVGYVLRRSVESLYSHLVTRPTGRAVRLAIEEQVVGSSRTALSLIDLSDVTVMDFSCADEVVAKLLMRFLEEDRPVDALFVFRGVCQNLHEPIQTVLERQELLAVTQGSDGCCSLMERGPKKRNTPGQSSRGAAGSRRRRCRGCFRGLIIERPSMNSCSGASRLRLRETISITRSVRWWKAVEGGRDRHEQEVE